MPGVPILVAERAEQVLFPGSFTPRELERDECPPEIVEGAEVAVFCRSDDGAHPYREQLGGLHEVGCKALVRNVVADEQLTLVLEGTQRVRIAEVTRQRPHLLARLVVVLEWDLDDLATRMRAAMVRELAKAIVHRMPELPYEAFGIIDSVEGSGPLADLMAANLDVTFEEKAAFLSIGDAHVRIERVLPLLVRQSEILELRERMMAHVEAELAPLDPAFADPTQVRALQRRFLVEEGEHERAPVRESALRGILRRVAGEPSASERIEADLEQLRARTRREVRELQLRALDAEG